MRIFAVSDLHVDYDVNARWVEELSTSDFQDDVLILAGDISDSLVRLERCLRALSSRFRKLLFVPGNHDLWVCRDDRKMNSLDKFQQVCRVALESGASMRTFQEGKVAVVPLLGWYDYSFAPPEDELKRTWMDFFACRWPLGWEAGEVTEHFLGMNDCAPQPADTTTISFSHFLPRIDLMPWFIPPGRRNLYPVLGSDRLGEQVKRLKSSIHVYGHSHFNRNVKVDGTVYINNAFAYPHEARIAGKALQCIYQSA